jgi:hypothetical protein
LKIAAIAFGAWIAIAELLRDQPTDRSRTVRLRRTVALMIFSLGSAAAAEILDAILKHEDSASLSTRLSSSLRPLLPLRVAVSITASDELLRDSDYNAFVARLESEVPTECDFEARIRYGDGWFPKRAESEAWELAGTLFRAEISLRPPHSTTEIIAFTALEPADDELIARLKRRRFTFDRMSGLVIADFSPLINAGDLISDSPRIASFDDLAGAELVVELEPVAGSDAIELYEVTFQLPDGRRVSVHRSEFKRDEKNGSYSYTFPRTRDRPHSLHQGR